MAAARSSALILLASSARAQCPVPNGYNGDEPLNFTHFVDSDGDGDCDADTPKENGAYPNRTYPSCPLEGGGGQVAHGHWEYTHLQAEIPGDTEEKDYFEDPTRFAAKEPTRFDRALNPRRNPSGSYWQVDEWIGPPTGDPATSWTERFFECSRPEACATVAGPDGGEVEAVGGYWSTHAEQFGYEGFRYEDECGDGLVAAPAEPRSFRCGMLFVPLTDCSGAGG